MIDQHSERTFTRGTELVLLRRRFTDQSTISDLLWEGAFQSYILEPPRVGAVVCIPVGRYEIRLTHSEKFGVVMPIVCNVPGRQGIRIHVGNHPKDTLGCWLPGTGAPGFDFVANSTEAYADLFTKLQKAAGPIFVTVREA